MTDLATAQDEQDDAPVTPVSRRRRAMTVITWILVAGWLLWALGRLVGVDRISSLSSVLIPAMAIVPYVAAGVVIPLAVAALTRNWAALAVMVAVTAVFAGIVLPRAVGGGQPHATGPQLRILTANLRFGRPVTRDWSTWSGVRAPTCSACRSSPRPRPTGSTRPGWNSSSRTASSIRAAAPRAAACTPATR